MAAPDWRVHWQQMTATARSWWEEARVRLHPPVDPVNSHLHLSAELRVSGMQFGAHVVSRALCRFRYIDLQGLAGADRLGRLAVQLAAWSPFPDTDYSVVLGPRGAMVYGWDRAAFRERCQLAGLGLEPLRIVPEGFLHADDRDGLSLHACAEGFEGQVFHAGELVSSRWWPDRPDPADWVNFQRSSGVPVLASLPGSLSPRPWPPEPWGQPRLLRELQDRPRLRLHQGLAAAALVLMLPTLWMLKGWLAAEARTSELRADRREIESSAGPAMRSREEALASLASLELLTREMDRPDPVRLLAHLSRQLPDDGTVLRELEWQGSQLRMVITPAPGASRTAYIKALEGGGWLEGIHEVAAEQGVDGGGVVLVAELAGGEP